LNTVGKRRFAPITITDPSVHAVPILAFTMAVTRTWHRGIISRRAARVPHMHNVGPL